MHSAPGVVTTQSSANHSNVSVGPKSGSNKLAATVIRGGLTLAVLSLLLMAARPARAQSGTNIYSFPPIQGGNYGLHGPQAGLISDGAGNLYGTTSGNYGFTDGYVYELSPNGSGGWNETTLLTFTGANGSSPGYGALLYKNGNLYGVTMLGGAYNYGTVFELSPAGAGWQETVLYNFPGGRYNSYPPNGVIMDSAGNLYGTTFYLSNAGKAGPGAVFELSPSGSGWTEKLIYGYPLGNDSGLTMDAAGNIFGIGSVGASSSVFELSPNGRGGWRDYLLYTFSAAQGSGWINGTLAVDHAENLYGTAGFNGAYGHGRVFELSPTKEGEWRYRDLYNLTGNKYFEGAFAGVVLDASENIYGTTVYGGPSNQGTAFELSPAGDGKYTATIIDLSTVLGTSSYGSLLFGNAGQLYGTTAFGGLSGEGNAFEVTF